MTNKVQINLTLTWEVSKDEWEEGKDHWKENIRTKIEYDPVSMFYYLNQIRVPDIKFLEIKAI